MTLLGIRLRSCEVEERADMRVIVVDGHDGGMRGDGGEYRGEDWQNRPRNWMERARASKWPVCVSGVNDARGGGWRSGGGAGLIGMSAEIGS